jgi:ferredoxin
MILTQKKPIEELMAMLGDAKKIALIGCGSCATACATGGEKEIAELKAYLESHGKTVVATGMSDYCCMNIMTRNVVKKLNAAKPDAIIGMSCGDGVQVIAKHADCVVYPSNNTMFLGESIKLGLFEEACHLCGNCVLGQTGGICPISRCAKSLVNGPCGGARNGRCEVNPENPCAWIEIYNKLVSLGQEEKIGITREDKGYENVSYPRTVNIRGDKK